MPYENVLTFPLSPPPPHTHTQPTCTHSMQARHHTAGFASTPIQLSPIACRNLTLTVIAALFSFLLACRASHSAQNSPLSLQALPPPPNAQTHTTQPSIVMPNCLCSRCSHLHRCAVFVSAGPQRFTLCFQLQKVLIQLSYQRWVCTTVPELTIIGYQLNVVPYKLKI